MENVEDVKKESPHPPKPNNNLALAIVTTVLCCLPLGIVAIIKSTKVDELYALGQYELAAKHASDAKKYSLWGIGISAIIIVLYILLVAVLVLSGVLDEAYRH